MHLWRQKKYVFLQAFKKGVKGTLKPRESFENFSKVTAKPKVMQNLKSSLKRPGRIVEFEELKRVWAL